MSEQKAREIHAFLAAAKDAPIRTAYQAGTEETPEVVLGDKALAVFDEGEVGLREAERYAALLNGCEAVAELVRDQDEELARLRRDNSDLRDEVRRARVDTARRNLPPLSDEEKARRKPLAPHILMSAKSDPVHNQ